MVVPPKPRFMVMDITDPYLDWCAGIYVAESRNSGGFDYSQAAEDPATIEKKGRDGAAKMKALKDAADKVRRALVRKGKDPTALKNLDPEEVAQVLEEEQVPAATEFYSSDQFSIQVAMPEVNGAQATSSSESLTRTCTT